MPIDLAVLIPPRTDIAPPGAFVVAAIPGFPQHLVGRDDHGRACILVASTDSGIRHPVRLGGLAVQYALRCTVRLNGLAEERVLSVATSTNDTSESERYFLHVMATLVEIVGQSPPLAELAEAITQLAEIFQRLSGASRESVIGIIGELLVISCASNPIAAAQAWRADPDERYDFAHGNLRLEVKSSSNRRRVHEFSLEQTDVPAGCKGVVASVFVEKSSGGFTLQDLLQLLGTVLMASPSALLRVQQTLAWTLGSELPSALPFAFDYNLAISQLSLFDLDLVPAIRRPIPGEVSRVRFTSDLEKMSPIDPVALVTECSDYAAFAPAGQPDLGWSP